MFLAYSTFVRDALQVPMMATGFAICGLVFAAVARHVGDGRRPARAARAATAGRCFSALFGGIVAIGALMFLSAAMIMGMIWNGDQLVVTGGWYTRPAPPRVMGPHRLEA